MATRIDIGEWQIRSFLPDDAAALARLRTLMASDPSIHGSKKAEVGS